MFKRIDETFEKFKISVGSSKNFKDLQNLKAQYLGRSGYLTEILRKITSLDQEERISIGKAVNDTKDKILSLVESKKQEIEEAEINAQLEKEKIDVTLPSSCAFRAKMHPISYAINFLRDIYKHLGFEVVDGPEIENEWNNFTALNVPEDHPAREMQDTFYLEQDNLLLRTHTSNVQIRHMSENTPPFKIASIGKVYRSDYDATHSPMFHQSEGLVIDESSNFLDLKHCLKDFLALFLKKKI